MLPRYRHRRGSYSLVTHHSSLRRIVRVCIVLAIAWGMWKVAAAGVHLLFGIDTGEAVAPVLTLTPGVNIRSSSGTVKQPTHNSWDSGSTIITGNGSRATISFADGTTVRLEQHASMTLENSRKMEDGSASFTLLLEEGRAEVMVPADAQGTGVRQIRTSRFIAAFPSDTKAALNTSTVQVWSGDGDGTRVTLAQSDDVIVIGEGQQINLPDPIVLPLTDYRTALGGTELFDALFQTGEVPLQGSGSFPTRTTGGIHRITLSTPKEGESIRGSTVRVDGNAASDVEKIRINGYLATIDPQSRTFSADLAVGSVRHMTVTVEALDTKGLVIDEITRNIITTPTVETTGGSVASTTPIAGSSSAPADETLLPNNVPLLPGTLIVTNPTPGTHHTATGSEFLLEGATPTITDSVWVNGYRLQLYVHGKTFWNYIAATKYGTLKRGTNAYRINARNDKGEIIDSMTYTVEY